MYLIKETFKVYKNKIPNEKYHNFRMNKARKKLWGLNEITLSETVDLSKLDPEVVYKCNVEYNKKIEKISFIPYKIKTIRSLKIVKSDTIDYSYKYSNRSELEKLRQMKGECDDIIIIKNNFVTDASFSNVIFLKDNAWYAPDTFLLYGTAMHRLLDEKKIQSIPITKKDIFKYEKISMINTFYDIGDLSIDINQIFE